LLQVLLLFWRGILPLAMKMLFVDGSIVRMNMKRTKIMLSQKQL
jgi:hypothetical protein